MKRTMATAIAVDPDVVQFETLLLLIERLAKARKPTFMDVANMSVARWQMVEDQIEMTAQLDALSIPYPAADASNADWYRYLISLARLSKVGKLEEARKEGLKQSEIELREAIKAAYTLVQRVHKPEILNPEVPGNPAYMKELTQDAIDNLRSKLLAAGLGSPEKINVSSRDSLREWYDYLRAVIID